jgi:hypothetical protein
MPATGRPSPSRRLKKLISSAEAFLYAASAIIILPRMGRR